MLTEKDYCDYETCVALKELGYSEDFILAKDYEILDREYDILLYEAQKWLREEKGIHIEIDRIGYPTGYAYQVSVIEMEHNLCKFVINNNNTYEEALSEGIKAAVNILTNNKNE